LLTPLYSYVFFLELLAGAIDASEMLTAFNVLGMHVKKSEVEAMLAEVDANGSGEVSSRVC
jgi:Ca2+-binding EF-hand superfamily protein